MTSLPSRRHDASTQNACAISSSALRREHCTPLLQFFIEIDNVMRFLREEDVLEWHREMARTLHAIDRYNHLITTSLTSSNVTTNRFSSANLEF